MGIPSVQLPLRGKVRSRIGVALLALALSLTVAVGSQRVWTWTSPTPAEPVGAPVEERVTLPTFVHPGAHRGQVRLGRFDGRIPQPRAHRRDQRPKWGT
jgi:hypothetical protein